MRDTIKDIAKEVGVSITTVSLVVNNQPLNLMKTIFITEIIKLIQGSAAWKS